MNANEINEKYEVKRYHEPGRTTLVLPMYQGTVPTNLLEVLEANRVPFNEVEIIRAGIVEFINGSAVFLNEHEILKKKVALRWNTGNQ